MSNEVLELIRATPEEAAEKLASYTVVSRRMGGMRKQAAGFWDTVGEYGQQAMDAAGHYGQQAADMAGQYGGDFMNALRAGDPAALAAAGAGAGGILGLGREMFRDPEDRRYSNALTSAGLGALAGGGFGLANQYAPSLFGNQGMDTPDPQPGSVTGQLSGAESSTVDQPIRPGETPILESPAASGIADFHESMRGSPGTPTAAGAAASGGLAYGRHRLGPRSGRHLETAIADEAGKRYMPSDSAAADDIKELAAKPGVGGAIDRRLASRRGAPRGGKFSLGQRVRGIVGGDPFKHTPGTRNLPGGAQNVPSGNIPKRVLSPGKVQALNRAGRRALGRGNKGPIAFQLAPLLIGGGYDLYNAFQRDN